MCLPQAHKKNPKNLKSIRSVIFKEVGREDGDLHSCKSGALSRHVSFGSQKNRQSKKQDEAIARARV